MKQIIRPDLKEIIVDKVVEAGSIEKCREIYCDFVVSNLEL